MPFMKDGKRDYKKELAWEKEKKPNRVKDRAERNQSRKDLGLKVGDGKHADHKKPLTEGGSKDKSNLQAVSAKANLKKEAERKKKEAKKK